MTKASDRFIAYPDRAVVAVIDHPPAAEVAVRDLEGAGFGAGAITVLEGPEGAWLHRVSRDLEIYRSVDL